MRKVSFEAGYSGTVYFKSS